MPAAERLLAENKLRPDQVVGTGPGGRILKKDVARHVETKVTPDRAARSHRRAAAAPARATKTGCRRQPARAKKKSFP